MPRLKSFWFLPLPAAALVLVLNLAAHILYVILYSHLINPGHDLVDYQHHAVTSAPYVTFIVGFPSMIVVCWQVAKRTPKNYRYFTVLLVSLIYLLMDTTIVFVVNELSRFGLLFAISYLPYGISAFIGLKLAEDSKNKGGTAQA